jgi:hypothetical protein
MLTLVLYALLAIIAVGALYGLAMLYLSRAEQIAPAAADRAPWGLSDEPLHARDVVAVRLPVALRGYRFAETDLLLDRLTEELRARDEEIARLRGIDGSAPVAEPLATEPPATEPLAAAPLAATPGPTAPFVPPVAPPAEAAMPYYGSHGYPAGHYAAPGEAAPDPAQPEPPPSEPALSEPALSEPALSEAPRPGPPALGPVVPEQAVAEPTVPGHDAQDQRNPSHGW